MIKEVAGIIFNAIVMGAVFSIYYLAYYFIAELLLAPPSICESFGIFFAGATTFVTIYKNNDIKL